MYISAIRFSFCCSRLCFPIFSFFRFFVLLMLFTFQSILLNFYFLSLCCISDFSREKCLLRMRSQFCAEIHTGMASVAPTLSSFEDVVRRMIMDEDRMHKEVSEFLRGLYPLARGFSVRFIQRFCNAQGIHRTTRLCDALLDERVKASVDKVFFGMEN